jgi:hypothetical protein
MDDDSCSESVRGKETTRDTTLDSFLHQPALDADEDDEVARVASSTTIRPPMGPWRRLNNFLFNKQASRYSSIAPRTGDGRRSKIFFFNGNGRGR